MSLLEEAEHKCSLHLLSQMDPRSGSPSTLWTITHQGPATPHSQEQLRLVLGCHGLESDAARFRKSLKLAPPPAGSVRRGSRIPPTSWLHAPPLNGDKKSCYIKQDLIPALDSLVHDPECDPTAFTIHGEGNLQATLHVSSEGIKQPSHTTWNPLHSSNEHCLLGIPLTLSATWRYSPELKRRQQRKKERKIHNVAT